MRAPMERWLSAARTLLTRRLVITFDKLEFEYPRLSRRQLGNWALSELSYLLRLERPLGLPTHLQVEPCNLCNLRCPLCHVVTDDKPRGMLTYADFSRLMDEVGDRALFLHFWGWGEPFLNPDIYRMIGLAKRKRLKVITSTNGHFFEREADVDRLIDSGLDALIFALDGVDPETYERYRRRGDYARAVDGLRRLLTRRRARGASCPRVNLRMLVTRENEDQVPAMQRLSRELGVDVLTLKTMNAFDNPTHGASLVPRDPAFRRFEYDDAGEPLRVANSCKKLWNHPTVYRDGTVVPCDYHTGQELSLGTAFAGSSSRFTEVWRSSSFRNLRHRFRRHDLAGLRCQECSLNFAGVDRCVSHAFAVAGPAPTARCAQPEVHA